MEVVINTCFGGFGLSDEAISKLKNLLLEQDPLYSENIDDLLKETRAILYTPVIFYRANTHLVRIVKEIGEKANSKCANLKVISIPDDAIEPYIHNYDGMEHVAEGRIWKC